MAFGRMRHDTFNNFGYQWNRLLDEAAEKVECLITDAMSFRDLSQSKTSRNASMIQGSGH